MHNTKWVLARYPSRVFTISFSAKCRPCDIILYFYFYFARAEEYLSNAARRILEAVAGPHGTLRRRFWRISFRAHADLRPLPTRPVRPMPNFCPVGNQANAPFLVA